MLMEHTIQKQLADQRKMTETLQTQVTELTSLLKTQLTLTPKSPHLSQRKS